MPRYTIDRARPGLSAF